MGRAYAPVRRNTLQQYATHGQLAAACRELVVRWDTHYSKAGSVVTRLKTALAKAYTHQPIPQTQPHNRFLQKRAQYQTKAYTDASHRSCSSRRAQASAKAQRPACPTLFRSQQSPLCRALCAATQLPVTHRQRSRPARAAMRRRRSSVRRNIRLRRSTRFL